MSRICRPVTETLFVVCPVFMLFKDIASERKQSLLLVSRVQLYLMQRYCQRAERELALGFPSAAISYANIVQTFLNSEQFDHFFRMRSPKAQCGARSIHLPAFVVGIEAVAGVPVLEHLEI